MNKSCLQASIRSKKLAECRLYMEGRAPAHFTFYIEVFFFYFAPMCANCIKRKEAGADFFAYMSIIYRFLNFYSYIIASCFKNKKIPVFARLR